MAMLQSQPSRCIPSAISILSNDVISIVISQWLSAKDVSSLDIATVGKLLGRSMGSISFRHKLSLVKKSPILLEWMKSRQCSANTIDGNIEESSDWSELNSLSFSSIRSCGKFLFGCRNTQTLLRHSLTRLEICCVPLQISNFSTLAEHCPHLVQLSIVLPPSPVPGFFKELSKCLPSLKRLTLICEDETQLNTRLLFEESFPSLRKLVVSVTDEAAIVSEDSERWQNIKEGEYGRYPMLRSVEAPLHVVSIASYFCTGITSVVVINTMITEDELEDFNIDDCIATIAKPSLERLMWKLASSKVLPTALVSNPPPVLIFDSSRSNVLTCLPIIKFSECTAKVTSLELRFGAVQPFTVDDMAAIQRHFPSLTKLIIVGASLEKGVSSLLNFPLQHLEVRCRWKTVPTSLQLVLDLRRVRTLRTLHWSNVNLLTDELKMLLSGLPLLKRVSFDASSQMGALSNDALAVISELRPNIRFLKLPLWKGFSPSALIKFLCGCKCLVHCELESTDQTFCDAMTEMMLMIYRNPDRQFRLMPKFTCHKVQA